MSPEDLTQKIDNLTNAFHQLETAKTATGQIRDTRTMRPGGRLGPQTPGHDTPVNLSIELETRLFDFISDAKRHIQPHRIIPKQWPAMLAWLRFNAEAITNLGNDYPHVLAEELTYQTHTIHKTLEPQPINTQRPEPWRPAGTIAALARSHGHNITPERLRQLAARDTIDHTTDGRRNLYRATQVINYLKGLTP